jgi:hypothetical protein
MLQQPYHTTRASRPGAGARRAYGIAEHIRNAGVLARGAAPSSPHAVAAGVACAVLFATGTPT